MKRGAHFALDLEVPAFALPSQDFRPALVDTVALLAGLFGVGLIFGRLQVSQQGTGEGALQRLHSKSDVVGVLGIENPQHVLPKRLSGGNTDLKPPPDRTQRVGALIAASVDRGQSPQQRRLLSGRLLDLRRSDRVDRFVQKSLEFSITEFFVHTIFRAFKNGEL